MLKELHLTILNLFRKIPKKARYEGIIRFEAGSLFIDRKPGILSGIDLMSSANEQHAAKKTQYPTCDGCANVLTEHFFSSKLTGRTLCGTCFNKLRGSERTA